jgi:uncharacterized RDD family membrane protein YckC
MLDTLRPVETPEGLALDLRCAGVVPRALAWAIDLAIRFGIGMAIVFVAAFFGEAGVGVMLVGAFTLLWIYPMLFEVLNDGQTPGKRAMGLRVVCDNGTPVTWRPAIVRNLMRTADMLPAAFGIGIAMGLSDPWSRRLGDLVAGTVVVYVDVPPERRPAPAVAAAAPRLPLQPGEQRAIVAFAERASRMTSERQAELAELLAPVTGQRGQGAVDAVLAIANHLLGRRA